MGSSTAAFESGVIGISPFARPDVPLVLALCRAGAAGVLDAGLDAAAGESAIAELARAAGRPFGVLVRDRLALAPGAVPESSFVILDSAESVSRWKPRTVLVQATSLDEARAAAAAGADGVIAKGAESGGRVGEEGAFILLQQLARELELPIWVQGGIGLHSAAACRAGGAAGVVLDSQLALLRESTIGEGLRRALAALDGSETVVLGGHRLLALPGRELPERLEAEAVASRLGGDDPEAQLVPAGQEAALAADFARRFSTAGGLVAALRASVRDSLRAARRLQPLAPGSPLAKGLGIEYPILQGPMTRVSDRASFAAEVAEAGGLPFVALSLTRGEDLKRLLAETKERLGARPWGVGILGFVPRELREEQLAALAEVKPPVALIAGGRPSQARRLEAEGVPTWLHVPSPGLLDMFLADGARRFVFEGRECGGHVGPRSSFALWESQVARLLAFGDLEGASVVFAGGIHDSRSAAMVAALAAPLAERGVSIGLLMGTAYLFTKEAVSSGAIGERFQREALAAQRTVLLETAPGHSTRCADSPYVERFRSERDRLLAEGADREAAWQELERLNLGRLRIASKGIERRGDALVEVDEETQAREGMFMLGQVAALRDEVCSIAELHEEVSRGGAERLAGPAAELEVVEEEPAEPADVAIVGIACLFPGARDTEEFWANVVGGVDSVTEVADERWSRELYYDPEPGRSGRTVSKWGGFLSPVSFDPLRYGLPPRSLSSIEPVQLLSLEVARRALDDAGYAEREFDRERASVIFGTEAGTDLSAAYGFRALHPQYLGELPSELDEALPRLTEDSFPGVLANVISGRIANRLDLGGVNYTVDAACASSLAAVDLAVKELRSRTSDLVLCGGADLHNSINDYLMFSSVHALSPTGRCRTFDSTADGIVLAEGVACVALKRLEDAQRDGDRVYAVIKSVAGSSDGRSLGLTAPRREGQVRALDRAYRRAGLSPAEIGLVEAHGTGTVVGDRTELETLEEVFGAAGARPAACTLGSLKSQIGHSKCAAGLAGLIKVALSLHRRVLPPTIHLEKPNAGWKQGSSPFTLTSASRPWLSEDRKGCVSAFGFGGTNFHAVLAAADDGSPAPVRPFPEELFLFRARDRREALARVAELAAWLEPRRDARLRDVAFTLARSGEGAVQVALVAAGRDELLASLRGLLSAPEESDDVFLAGGLEGKVAFLFPGQGSQRPGMLAELFIAFPELQRTLELGREHGERIFPPGAWSPEARARQVEALKDTRVAQPALALVNLAASKLFAALGVRPAMLGGHSHGELVALCAAGALPEADLIALSERRAACILEAAGDEPGTMAAVAASADRVVAALGEDSQVVVANDNAPAQAVISGSHEAVAAARARLREEGLPTKELTVACAFHGPIVAGASKLLAVELERIRLAAPLLPVWSNTTAQPHEPDPAAIRARLAEHVARPVRFREQVEAMYEAGARHFVEVGPGSVLSGLTRRILGERPHDALSIEAPGRGGLRALLSTLGRLATRGVELNAEALFAGADAQPLDFRAPPPAPVWTVDGHLVRGPDGEPPRGGLRPIERPLVTSAPAAAPAPAAPVPGERERVVLESLRNLRELVEAQRDIVLGYLGAPAAAPAPPAVTVEAAAAEAPPAPSPVEPPAAEERVDDAPAEDLEEALVALVADKTGYPREMLGLDLDLEAELSIDSIKRVEIVGTLATRLDLAEGGDEGRDALIEELAACKTLRQMLEWLEEHAGPGSSAGRTPEPTPEPTPEAPVEAAGGERSALRRYVLNVEDAPRPEPTGPIASGLRFVLTDDGRGVARQLARLLERDGAQARILGPGEKLAELDGLVYLGLLADQRPAEAAKELFELAGEAVRAEARWVLGVTALGGRFGRGRNGDGPPLEGGVAGFLKSLAKEQPGLCVRAVDVEPDEEPERIAELLRDELGVESGPIDVGYASGVRRTLAPVPSELQHEEEPQRLPLDAEAVVLLTGGARGITARVAEELYRRTGCRLELVGRSAPEEAGDDELEAASDLPALRALLSARGGFDGPRAVEAEARRVLRAREVRRTLEGLRAAGARVRYHALDVSDPEAFGRLLDELQAEHGRLDGVVHGAGVIEDRLLRDKSRESFDRVYDTKVSAARTLLERLRADTRFVVFFSSVAGAFGNRGQVDYAAANDALDKLALELDRRIEGRVVSINWGPWSGTGMITSELATEYARRGIGLIEPEEGVARLLDELAHGVPESQVILTCAEPALSA